MKETYYLNRETLPTIHVPHDCVVQEIRMENQALVFLFEDHISDHESIQAIHPTAKSLIIRYHLTEEDSFSVYQWRKPQNSSQENGCYQCLDNVQLFQFAGHIEYLYHNVGYCSIIIKLCADNEVILDANADYLEYEWIE